MRRSAGRGGGGSSGVDEAPPAGVGDGGGDAGGAAGEPGTELPLAPETLVAVGLGVSTGDQAAEVTAFADGVIVGSAFVKTLIAAEAAGKADDLSGLRAVLADLAQGVRR